MRGLQGLLRVARVVAAELLVTERGAVAGITKNNGKFPAVGIRHLEHGHDVIHRTIGIGKVVPSAAAIRCPAVHGNTAARLAVVQRGRHRLFHGLANDADECVLKLVGVGRCFGFTFRRVIGAMHSAGSHFRAAVRVTGIDGDPRRVDAKLLLHLLGDMEAHVSRHADQIHRDQRKAASTAVLNDQCLGIQIQLHPF